MSSEFSFPMVLDICWADNSAAEKKRTHHNHEMAEKLGSIPKNMHWKHTLSKQWH
jgi:hypothetical protein